MRTWQNGDVLNATNLNNAQSDLLEDAYPVGSLYKSYGTSDPATLFGGTWTERECNDIIDNGSINAININGCQYRIYANGDFELFGITSLHDIGGVNSFTIEVPLPFDSDWCIVNYSLASGGSNFAMTQRYASHNGQTNKITLYEYNNSSGLAQDIIGCFIGKGNLNLEDNSMETIHCYERTA